MVESKYKVHMSSDSGRRTIRGSVGGGHHHHSGLEQRLKQLLQDHGISNVSHLTEENQRRQRDTFTYCIIYLFLPHSMCVSVCV